MPFLQYFFQGGYRGRRHLYFRHVYNHPIFTSCFPLSFLSYSIDPGAHRDSPAGTPDGSHSSWNKTDYEDGHDQGDTSPFREITTQLQSQRICPLARQATAYTLQQIESEPRHPYETISQFFLESSRNDVLPGSFVLLPL